MKLETFATLAAVIEEGSFAAAAATMHLTPSAVSMQMKQLEQYLGQPLFDRSGLQVRPNALAREVAAAMEGGLRHLNALRRRASVAVEGTVRLGVIESMQPVLLPGTLRYLRERYPRLTVKPVRGRSAGLIEMVKAAQLDAAVVARPESGRLASLRWYPVATRELQLIAPPGSRGESAADLLARYDWIRYDKATVTGAMAARHVHGLLPDKRSAMEFDSVTAIVAMVSAGLGVSVVQLMDPTVIDRYPVRRIRLGPDAPVLLMSLVLRKADEDNRLLQALREAVTATLGVG
ncbi:LysR family transcriptional regulator [Cupriavidus pauculus]|uniref:LysR family transcriptional regulator n=1 Tax=Cupriavidus pauculus TaxID=82633 RepID=A0A3G8H6J5_9BURK|nr:LysR family transcriptional regulator [Cupriavidus pauculus]AZG15825.1 LysR family transcriptional regulator [Cupriavidus pauculus]